MKINTTRLSCNIHSLCAFFPLEPVAPRTVNWIRLGSLFGNCLTQSHSRSHASSSEVPGWNVLRESSGAFRCRLTVCVAMLAATLLAGFAHSQSVAPSAGAPFLSQPTPATPQFFHPMVTHVIVPQHRVVPVRPGVPQGVTLVQVDAADLSVMLSAWGDC